MFPKEKPRADRIVWYQTRASIPEIAPAKPFGLARKPQGQKDDRTLVANSPEPVSTKQFIWRPERPEPIPADAPAPNLVALSAPKPEPKAFVPPAPRPRTEPMPILEAPPVIEPKPAPKLFVPPPPKTGAPADPVQLTELPPLVPQEGVPSLAGAGSVLQAVVVGLSPAPGNLPEGSRPARFARAPTAGPPSSGAAPPNGTPTVPGLLVHNKPGLPSEAAPAPRAGAPERLVVKETSFPTLNRTLSAPLRPSSRVIPASVETQFANRNVYTLVLPAPDLPEYAGDWVLWFSERLPTESTASRVSAPTPARKYSLVGSSAPDSSPSANGSVQLAAVIDRNGRISAPRILRGLANEDFRLKAIEELQSWEFRPALRNGQPIDVDIVLEIPFQFRNAVQQAR